MSLIIQNIEKIKLSPETLEEEISQNIIHLLNTMEGTVPLNREFGLSVKAIDKPIFEAKSIYIQEIFEKIKRFEPRFQVQSVEIEDADFLSGVINPKIKGSIVEG